MSLGDRARRRRLRFLLVLAFTAPRIISAQDHSAQINGVRLNYEVSGQGTPVVFIHGWTLNLRMWDPQVMALNRRFRVIRYDRRGFGKSSGSEDLSWDAADLAALLDTLGVTRAHIVGNSQGGRVALQFARNYPSRVASLVLHGTSPPDGIALPWSGPDRTRFDEWTAIARQQGMDAFRRVWAAHPLMKVPVNRPAARARLMELLADYRGGRFLNPATPSGPGAAATLDDLSRINASTLVLIGDDEVPYLQMVARVLVYYIPNARLTVVPGGGHLVNLIEPARYNEAVLGFLADLERGRKER